MFHKLEIKPIEDYRFKVFLDGNKVMCNALDIRLRVDEVPSCKIGLLCEPEIEIPECAVSSYSTVEKIAATRKKRKRW